DFHHEAANSIFDSLQKGQDPDTIQLELKALTLAANAEGKQIRRAVAVAFAKRMANLVETGKSAKEAASSTVSSNQLLVERCVDADSAEEQVEFLLFLQTDLVHRQQGSKLLLFASFQLANNDLADADGFREWWEDERSSASDELKSVKAETKQVVDFLQDQEESSDEDDDDDDDEDED
ncbi:hypothetical protein KC343_g11925, partial [Hortaea werneckii]